MSTDAMIAILFAGLFAVALAVRAWTNTNRILADRRMQARLRQVARHLPPMDPQRQQALRAALVAWAAGEGDHYAPAPPDEPIPYALTDKAMSPNLDAAPRRRSFYRCIGGL